MRVGILWKDDYPWEVRVEKIACSLAEAGHEVFILCGNAQGRSRIEKVDRIHVRRLPATRSSFLNSMISIPFYLNPFWFRLANHVVTQEQIDLLIIRDLPLIAVGLWLKRRHHLPLILDMAENYPAMYRENLSVGGMRAVVLWVMKNPKLMAFVERKAIRAVDHTLVVVEESARRVKGLMIPEGTISVVSNTPRVTESGAIRAPLNGQSRSFLRLVYVGAVQEGRGLEVVVRALRALHDKGQDVRLRVVGDGDYMKELTRLVRKERLVNAVEFMGWTLHTQIMKYICDSDIGVIPHRKDAHTDTTIPNKLFDYMAAAKPVVVSNADPLERIVTEENCGLVFASGSSKSLVEILTRMMVDPVSRERMGQNGMEAVRRRYNWDCDAAVLRDVVARVGSVST